MATNWAWEMAAGCHPRARGMPEWEWRGPTTGHVCNKLWGLYLQGFIDGSRFMWLIDTGAACSILSLKIYNSLPGSSSKKTWSWTCCSAWGCWRVLNACDCGWGWGWGHSGYGLPVTIWFTYWHCKTTKCRLMEKYLIVLILRTSPLVQDVRCDGQ